MPVSRRLRYEILRRDDHACRYCGGRAPDVPLTVDHVLPIALGGSDDPSNLAAACRDCNAGKSSVAPDSPIVANVSDDAIRWLRAMALAAQMQAQDRDQLDAYIARIDEMWRQSIRHDQHYPRPADWRDSAQRLYEQGLELEVVKYAIDVTSRQERVPFGRLWNYFCGICWRRLDERKRIATDLLQGGAV